MRDATPSAIHLKDYRPPDYLVDSIDLRFDIQADFTIVTSRMRVRRREGVADSAPLVLDGQELELLSIRLDDEEPAADVQVLTEQSLALHEVPARFQLVIETRIYPQRNTRLEGLYRSGSLYCTQCEAEGFRYITYYPDRPDVMARFSTEIVADRDSCPVMLSNGNLVDTGELPGNRHRARWEDPYPKPSYLFALVAGQLAVRNDEYVTRSGRQVLLRLYTEPHNSSKTTHAMRSLKQAMRWDEEVYGLEYDLDMFMIVAVDDFNMGAMENKGLNIFNTSCVLARPDTATDADYDRIQSIVGHEYFHNWTGNRVTCRDWFQLSLKEGLTVFRDQEFSADLNSRAVKRIEEVRILREHQFPEDDGPTAHPVRPDNYIEISNFYTATVYRKGAEVIRMLHTLIGAAAFRRGMDLYFQRHDGQAVTTDDFVNAMQDASGQDLSQFRRWYSQAGTPVIHVSSKHDSEHGELCLTIRQETPPTPGQPDKQPLHIPLAIGLLDRDGNDMPVSEAGEVKSPAAGTHVLQIRESSQSFRFACGTERPVVSLLRGFSAPVRVDYARDAEEIAFLLRHDSDAFTRWEASQTLAMQQMLSHIDDAEHQAPDFIIPAYAEVLTDHRLDTALVAEIFALPSENYLADNMPVVNVDAIHKARQSFYRHLASGLEEHFAGVYRNLLAQAPAKYDFNAADVANRRLRNTALHYLMELARPSYIDWCLQQFRQADNMTDSLAALSQLANCDCEARREVLDEFYRKWSADTLVVNKWLAVQAMSRLPGTLQRVRELTAHPAFDLRNPNKVRALLGSFCNANPVQFHAPDGQGYAFLTDHIVELDPLNPQIAARLLTPLTRWRRYDDTRQQRMREQLERILARQNLSRDVFEICSKSLKAGRDSGN